MRRFWCPYLHGTVELPIDRETHIQREHPELISALRERIAETLTDPDIVRRSARSPHARLFSRWHDSLLGGKHVVVVVVSEPVPPRHWIVTAYVARAVTRGRIEWERN